MYLLEQETRPRVDDIRFIPLTQGQFARVSACDYDRAMRRKWFAQWNSHTRSFYAYCHTTVAEGKNRAKLALGRFILGLDFGDKRQAEHKSSDTLDNTRLNLRFATTSENQGNRRKPRTNTSGYKGACEYWRKGVLVGYLAQIVYRGKRIYLGIFPTALLAHEAYCAKARELHGEFARAG